MKVRLNQNILFGLILCTIILIGSITSVLSPNWYKVQLKIMPSKTTNVYYQSNATILTSSLELKSLYSDFDISRYVPYYIKTESVIKKTILKEIPEWSALFYDEDIIDIYDNNRLENLIYKFQNEYINTYNIPNTSIYLIELNLPLDPILCKNIALQLFYQLEEKLHIENNKYLNNEYEFLQSALSNINMQITKTENLYLEYIFQNKIQNNIKTQNIIEKYKKKLIAYNEIFKTTKNRLDVIRLNQQNQHSYFDILETNLNPVIKYKPYKATVISVTLICVLVLVIFKITIQKNI